MPATKKLSARKTNGTRKRKNLVLEQKAKKYRLMYEEMVSKHEFPCEVAYNIVLLLMQRRDAYLFERYTKSSLPGLKKMIEFIEEIKTPAGKPWFQLLYLKARFNVSKTQKITKEEYLADHSNYDLIIYRSNDKKTEQILGKDMYSVEFGKLLKLVCAADLTEFYANKMYQRGLPHGGQIRYYIDCDGQKSDFMIQMCPAVASPETQKLLADDISQYQAIGRGLGINTIGWHSPKMGKFAHGLFWMLIKFWRFFAKKTK